MLQSRILKLPADGRQIVLAASVLGQSFWPGGIRALLPDLCTEEQLEMWLERLVQNEIIERKPKSRFADEPEYAFRHALVCDASYGLLLESDKPLAHERAARYLESIGEPDSFLLGEHYRQAQNYKRASSSYADAALRLFDHHDLAGAQRSVNAGLACEPTGETFVRLRALDAGIAFWNARALSLARERLGDSFVLEILSQS